MHAHGGAVHHERLIITQSFRSTSEHRSPQAIVRSEAKPVTGRLPRADDGGYIPPWRPGPHNPEHSLDPETQGAVIAPAATSLRLI